MNRLKVTLKIQPPFLSNQQGALPFGLDAQSLQYDGEYMILGSLIKGNLRELMLNINHPHTTSWLGKPPNDTDDPGKQTGDYSLLVFSYFWRLANQDKTVNPVRKQIKIDQEAGTVGDGMLRFSEVLETTHDEALAFIGEIYLNPRYQNPDKTLQDIKEELERLLNALPALGGNRGIGYGKLLKATIESSETQARLPLADSIRQQILRDKALEISIMPEWPICFAKITNSNDLVSKDYIPGAAIKAVLASNITNKTEVQEAFDRMRVTHARYARSDSTGLAEAIPLSVAKTGDQYSDMAQQNRIDPLHTREATPRFQPDWKSSDFASYTNSPPTPERHLQVRNQHSAQHHAAKEKGLFSIESLKPKAGYCWRARINLPDENTEALLDAIIQASSDGIFPLGKTQAPASVEISTSSSLINLPELKPEDIVILTLQTPAQLFSMDNGKVKNMPLTGGKEKLDELYREAWSALSDNSLNYQHSYSRQILKGGEAWYKQFGKNTQGYYQPQIFIEKGSVFVLTVNHAEKAQEKLADWQRFGLPTATGISDDWKENPWIRENGYGEVQISIEEGSNKHD